MKASDIVESYSEDTPEWVYFRQAPKMLHAVETTKNDLVSIFGENRVEQVIEGFKDMIQSTKGLYSEQRLKIKQLYIELREFFKIKIIKNTKCEAPGRNAMPRAKDHSSPLDRLDLARSSDYSIYLRGKQSNIDLKLSLFRGTVVDRYNHGGFVGKISYIHISERYLEEKLRGEGRGKVLMDIVHKIALENECDFVFCMLRPFDGGDLELLQNSHKKMGYKINKNNIALRILTPQGEEFLKDLDW